MGHGHTLTRLESLVCSKFPFQALVSCYINDLNSIANTFQNNHWDYVILDEGHFLRNRGTKISKDLRSFSKSKETCRLLLANPQRIDMLELYALFDWATSSNLLGSEGEWLMSIDCFG